MQLTPLALQLLEYSNKDLKFWCIYSVTCDLNWSITHEEIRIMLDKYDDLEDDFSWDNIEYFDLCSIESYEQANIVHIYWNPFWRWHICMLFVKQEVQWFWYKIDIEKLQSHFNRNPDLYDMDCLSRPEETQQLILDFLNSLQLPKENQQPSNAIALYDSNDECSSLHEIHSICLMCILLLIIYIIIFLIL